MLPGHATLTTQTHNKYTYYRLEQNLGRHPILESGRIYISVYTKFICEHEHCNCLSDGYHRSTAVINQRMSGAVKVRERTRFAKFTLLHHRFFVLQDNEGSMPHFKDCMKLSAPWEEQ